MLSVGIVARPRTQSCSWRLFDLTQRVGHGSHQTLSIAAGECFSEGERGTLGLQGPSYVHGVGGRMGLQMIQMSLDRGNERTIAVRGKDQWGTQGRTVVSDPV